MERKLLISDLTIGYEGLFDAADFFKLMDDWFMQNGYEKNDIKHIERVSEKGKFIDLEIMPHKELNEYVRSEIHIKLRIHDLTDTKFKKDKKEFKINKGKLSLSIDAFLATDIRNRRESNPMMFFLRTIFDKFINKEYISKFEQSILGDVKRFHNEMKSYLNLERYKEQA